MPGSHGGALVQPDQKGLATPVQAISMHCGCPEHLLLTTPWFRPKSPFLHEEPHVAQSLWHEALR